MEFLLLAPAAIGLYNKIKNKPATKLNTKIIDSVKGIAPNDFRKWHGAKPAAQRELEKTFHNVEPEKAPNLFPMDPKLTIATKSLYNISEPKMVEKTGTTFVDPFSGRTYEDWKNKDPTPTGSYATNTTNRAMQNLMGIQDPITFRKKEIDYLAPNKDVRSDLLDTGNRAQDPRKRVREAVVQNTQNNLNGYRPKGTNAVTNKPMFMNMVDGHFTLRAKPFMKPSMRVANEANDGKRGFNTGGLLELSNEQRADLPPTVDKTMGGLAPVPTYEGNNFERQQPLTHAKVPCTSGEVPSPLAAENLDQASKHATVRAPKVRRGKRKNGRRAKATKEELGKAKRQRPTRAFGRLRGLRKMHLEAVQALETGGVVLRAENPLLGKDRTMKALENQHMSLKEGGAALRAENPLLGKDRTMKGPENQHMTLEGAGSVFDRGQVQTSNRQKNAGGKGSQTGGGGDFAKSAHPTMGQAPKERETKGRAQGGFHETIERADLSGARNCFMQPLQARAMPMDRAAMTTSASSVQQPQVQTNRKQL